MRRTHEDFKRMGLIIGAVALLAPSARADAPAPPAPPAKDSAAAPTKAPAPPPAPPATGTVTARAAVPPNPKKLYAAAEAKRAAGDFAGALADYQAADAVAPTPATLEAIAFCHDKLGHFDEALTWYQGFLANVPAALQPLADAAKGRVEAIKGMPGTLRVESAPANAVVMIDGKEQPTHTPLDVELAPGKHLLHITAADHDPLDREVLVASRSKQSVAIELPLTPPPPPPPVAVAPPPPPPPPPPPRSLVPAYVTGGLAIVAAGIGTGFGIAALNDKSSYNSHPTTDTANSGEDHALIADMGFGIALTLGVTSIILCTPKNERASVLPPAAGEAPKPATPPEAPKTSFTLAPFATPHGGGAGGLLRF